LHIFPLFEVLKLMTPLGLLFFPCGVRLAKRQVQVIILSGDFAV
jgi:hypothetical protein